MTALLTCTVRPFQMDNSEVKGTKGRTGNLGEAVSKPIWQEQTSSPECKTGRQRAWNQMFEAVVGQTKDLTLSESLWEVSEV